jgi:NADP-dependent alcohol dehydrogenase
MIGHELTAVRNRSCRTLAVVGPNLYRVMFETKKGKLAQYGKRIFNLTGTEDENRSHQQNSCVFHTMGMDTKLSDYTKDFDKTANFIVNRFEERGWLGLGKNKISL